MQKQLLLLVLGFTLSAFGQSNYAGVTGTVTDPQHLPVVGAAIQLTAASTGAMRHVVTDQRGLFEALALLPDDYELTTEAPGFAPDKQSVRLEVGQKLTVAISLTVGPVKQGVNVTAANEVLHTTDASVGEVVEPKSIRELPLNGRMLIDLVLTVPGAHVGFGKRARRILFTGVPASAPRLSLAAVARMRTSSCWMGQPIRIQPSTPRT